MYTESYRLLKIVHIPEHGLQHYLRQMSLDVVFKYLGKSENMLRDQDLDFVTLLYGNVMYVTL